jgi:hypothetical protein
MRKALLHEDLKHVYDSILAADGEHLRCMEICAALKAEHPELYAAVLSKYHDGRGRAAVRRALLEGLPRLLALACAESLANGASRVCASAANLGVLLTREVVEELLRCVLSAARVGSVQVRTMREPLFVGWEYSPIFRTEQVRR